MGVPPGVSRCCRSLLSSVSGVSSTGCLFASPLLLPLPSNLSLADKLNMVDAARASGGGALQLLFSSCQRPVLFRGTPQTFVPSD
eukprot:m.12752 g.12752  ORF g.12752 m.12752 type:complete len:85 (-) comp4352_c0_seq1:714-968(-)